MEKSRNTNPSPVGLLKVPNEVVLAHPTLQLCHGVLVKIEAEMTGHSLWDLYQVVSTD